MKSIFKHPIFKQSILWIGLGSLVVVLIAITRGGGESANTTAKPQQADSSGSAIPDSAIPNTAASNSALVGKQATGPKHTPVVNSQGQSDTGNYVPRHQDMLSDEMKQAIRDQLFQHGPKRIIKQPNGTVLMPSDGRFTQVPVAVQMPDGTIQIKEYSELPK
jgi:hypothetical protein